MPKAGDFERMITMYLEVGVPGVFPLLSGFLAVKPVRLTFACREVPGLVVTAAFHPSQTGSDLSDFCCRFAREALKLSAAAITLLDPKGRKVVDADSVCVTTYQSTGGQFTFSLFGAHSS
jgi:hypothetical protein